MTDRYPMMGKYLKYLVIAIVLAGVVAACGCTAAGEQDGQESLVSGNGTVTYVDLEGGFYGIVAEDGEHYLPLDLPAEFREDGLEVAFVVEVKEDVATIQMWGTPVEIRTIERIGGPNLISGNGTVTYVNLEGGFYGIVAEDGERYLPLNLSEDFRVDGRNVTFVLEMEEDVMTIQQWGTPVKVVAVAEAGTAAFVAKSGTITFVDLEGGFYGIVADDSERYFPLNLSETYLQDGMRIVFVAEVMEDVVTIQQWGTPVEIIDIPRASHVAPHERSAPGQNAGMANPASVWCEEQGNTCEIRKNPDGSEYGVCILQNGTEIDEWDYYRQTH